MEKVVADNLSRLMKHHGHEGPTQAARETKVSQQQIDRILKGQRVRVDTLESLARGYGLEPYQLLIPDLDPANPQVLRSLGPSEERVYKAMRAAMDELAKKGTN